VRPYYIVPDGKVGHDAYAVIRETIKSLDKVAIAHVVLTKREHIIALEARDKGLMGMLLRFPYEVREASETSTISRMAPAGRCGVALHTIGARISDRAITSSSATIQTSGVTPGSGMPPGLFAGSLPCVRIGTVLPVSMVIAFRHRTDLA
jgi:hypothetical protein